MSLDKLSGAREWKVVSVSQEKLDSSVSLLGDDNTLDDAARTNPIHGSDDDSSNDESSDDVIDCNNSSNDESRSTVTTPV